jgi:2-polyprenyl-3-methyl-5-hydroxy-6-metoxy-1,4-benzoquinol methylase
MKYLKSINESIRSKYLEFGVEDYYKNYKNDYKNPHSERVIKSLDYVISKISIGYFLDLACGDGVVSDYLKSKGFYKFKGCDPYFSKIYENKFKTKCYDFTFQDISKGGFNEKFDTIICSYALHLCNKSYLNNLLYQLSVSCYNFVVISPSKFPIISEDYFKLFDNKVIDRTHVRIYKSIL